MTAAGELAYLDASAFLKLILGERESIELREAVREWAWASSALLEVEVVLGVRRRDPRRVDSARRLLSALWLLDVDADVRRDAGELVGLRSLDAIHLATARLLAEDLAALVSYDERLLSATSAAGLPTATPKD